MKRTVFIGVVVAALSVTATAALAAGPYAYVAGQLSNGTGVVTVVDTSNNTIVTRINLGLLAGGIAFSPDGSKLYLSQLQTGAVTVISTATNTITTVVPPSGTAAGRLTVSPDGSRLYVFVFSPVPLVAVIQTSTNSVLATIPLPGASPGSSGGGIVVTPDGSKLYVANSTQNGIVVISTASNTILTTIPVGAIPSGVAISANGALVAVANAVGNSVSLISTATDTAFGPVAVGLDPRSVVFSPDGARLYVASTSGFVSVVDTSSRTVATAVPIIGFPTNLSVTPDGAFVYVSVIPNSASLAGSVQVVSTASNMIVAAIPFTSATEGTPGSIGIAPIPAVLCPSCPTLTLLPEALNFGAINTGGTLTSVTPAQTLTLTQSGIGDVPWTVTTNQPWISVSPTSGSGPAALSVSIVNTGGVLPLPGPLAGTITVNAGAAANSPSATVNLTVLVPGTSIGPAGTIDTPLPLQSGITGSLPVSGWAVDDVQVAQVRIMRDTVAGEPPGGQVFIGVADFVTGARPDVAALYPTKPFAQQAGWGYLMLTNFLPNQGNGTFTISAYADDVDGHTTLLGRRTIACTNATATAPFGAIDTPAQGGTVSGSAYVNFGWALAAQPAASGRFIPFDGSTVQVYVDSVLQGTATYNNARTDIQTLFPGYANTDGAVGFRMLDTTTLANGVHTIFWIVTDNLGAAAGIGSRYFTVSNSTVAVTARTGVSAVADWVGSAQAGGIARSGVSVAVRHGFDDRAWPESVFPDTDGIRHIRTAQLARVTVDLSTDAPAHMRYRGYTVIGDSLSPLPIGAHLDQATGQFAWAPGLAFGGTHHLMFVREGNGLQEQLRVDVTVDLPEATAGEPQLVIDIPAPGGEFGQPFTVAGWALDPHGPAKGTGIDTLHVWAYPVDGGAPRWIGVAAHGGYRPDVAALFGPRFAQSGFAVEVAALPPGTYDLVVYAHSTATNRFAVARSVRVSIR